MRTFKIHSTGNFQTCPTKPSTIITILRAAPMIYSFHKCKNVPPNPLPSFCPLPTPYPLQAALISLDAWVFGVLFTCFVFYIPYISKTIWYLFFSVWLISLSIIPSFSIMPSVLLCCCKLQDFILFHVWVGFLCVCVFVRERERESSLPIYPSMNT